MKNKKCKTCEYWYSGMCLRYPQQVKKDEDKKCGEHKEKK